jgi:WD40 repeat protein
VFASAEDFSIQRWHIASGKVAPLAGHQSWVWTMAFHPSGSTLYSGSYDGRVIFWEPTSEAPAPQRTIEAHNGWVRAVAVSPDGALLATAGNDHLVKLWNALDGQLVDVLAGHAHHVYNVAFHPKLPVIISGDLKGVVREWDLATGEELRQFDAAALWKYDEGFGADIGGLRSIAISGDGKHLACGGITEVSNAFAGIGTPLVVVFNLETGEKVQSLLATKKFRGKTSGVFFHPDGFVVGSTSGHDGGHLLFWKLDKAEEFFAFKMPDSARDLDMHADKLRLATADGDGMVRLWRMTAKAS